MVLQHVFRYVPITVALSVHVTTVCKKMVWIYKHAHNCHLYQVSVTNRWWKTNTWIYMFVLRVT
jgi:hypothetical protein